MKTIFSQNSPWISFWVKIGFILWIASSYFLLSLRKITWLNSQDFLLRTQSEANSSWKQNSPVRGARSLKSPSNEALACTRDLWGGGPLGGIPSLGVPLGLKGPQGVAVEVTHLWLSIFSKGIRDEGLLFRQLWIKSLQSADTRVRNVMLALLEKRLLIVSNIFDMGQNSKLISSIAHKYWSSFHTIFVHPFQRGYLHTPYHTRECPNSIQLPLDHSTDGSVPTQVVHILAYL